MRGRADNVRLVRVLTGEDPPPNAKKQGDFFYVVDLLPRPEQRGGHGGRDRGGRDRGGGGRGGVVAAAVGAVAVAAAWAVRLVRTAPARVLRVSRWAQAAEETRIVVAAAPTVRAAARAGWSRARLADPIVPAAAVVAVAGHVRPAAVAVLAAVPGAARWSRRRCWAWSRRRPWRRCWAWSRRRSRRRCWPWSRRRPGRRSRAQLWWSRRRCWAWSRRRPWRRCWPWSRWRSRRPGMRARGGGGGGGGGPGGGGGFGGPRRDRGARSRRRSPARGRPEARREGLASRGAGRSRCDSERRAAGCRAKARAARREAARVRRQVAEAPPAAPARRSFGRLAAQGTSTNRWPLCAACQSPVRVGRRAGDDAPVMTAGRQRRDREPRFDQAGRRSRAPTRARNFRSR